MPVPSSRRVSPAQRAFQGVLLLLFLALSFQACGRVRLKMSGAPRAALLQVEECEAARELLGEEVDAAWWGWSHGYLRVPWRSRVWSATSGRVEWWMPVAGSSGRGVLHFMGEKSNGFWKLSSFLEAGGVTVHTSNCEVLSESTP